MSETVKMCDMPISIAAKVFEMLNPGKVTVMNPDLIRTRYFIVTDVEPKNLIYPEGWYYAKGCFRNKHQSTTNFYEEAVMKKCNDMLWKNLATYCTMD